MSGALALVMLFAAGMIAAGLYFGLRARTAPRDSGPDFSAELERLRAALLEAQRAQRLELTAAVTQSQQSLTTALSQSQQAIGAALAQAQQTTTGALVQQLGQLTDSNAQRLDALRGVVDARLKDVQADNAAKLEEMRRTVDEKLQTTLESRLGQSFKLVSQQLEQVYKGLGEMQTLAAGVGDLKRVLTNVKTRGNFGEVQLGALLEQVLTPEQYGSQVPVTPGSRETVDFAIRLPGGADGQPLWLPIDCKFPRDDYERLLDAQERADKAAADEAGLALDRRLRLEAASIRDKYIQPPHTTNFALLFLPTEGLFAEVLRRPGLFDALQREFHVTVAGPTTLLAQINSLQMGFRTLAIEKRSSEVWHVLGAVKTEFGKFGNVLEKVRDKLDQARNQIDETGVRSRAIERKLRGVEALPEAQAAEMLPAPDGLETDDR
ncbi:MAG TPA: DNA recombination protein RmuC [Candidatus Binatia bacterium]|nr:DNA recombination protein RmuC [Candidatus Binatia bacterium]